MKKRIEEEVNEEIEGNSEKSIEEYQAEAGDICVFLGVNKCRAEHKISPRECVDGSYLFCEKYQKFYEEYKNGKR